VFEFMDKGQMSKILVFLAYAFLLALASSVKLASTTCLTSSSLSHLRVT